MRKTLIIALLLLSPACLFYKKITIHSKGDFKLKQVDFDSLNNWQNDDHKKALQTRSAFLLNECFNLIEHKLFFQ